MNICVVAYKFGTEKEIGEHLGTYHYFIEKMRTLVRLGHEVYVIAPWLSWTKKGSTDVDGVKITRYYPPLFNHTRLLVINNLLRSLYIRATQRQVSKLDKAQRLDIIYVWQARETGYAVAQIADQLHAPFIFRQITAWHWHFERMKHDRKAQEKFAKAIYEKARKVVFLSQAAIEEAKLLGFPEDKGETIGVAIETGIFKPALEKKSGKNILFVGRINFAEKGVGVLAEAMKKVVQEIPEARLTIVGSGPEMDRLKELISKSGLQDNVLLAGKVPFSGLVPYLDAANLMVVPSIWMEAFGQVTIIGMAAGLPVITSDAGASPEINIDGETGFVVPANDPSKLSEAMIKVLKDENLAKSLGAAARKRVEENFTYEVLVNKFLEIVRKVNS